MSPSRRSAQQELGSRIEAAGAALDRTDSVDHRDLVAAAEARSGRTRVRCVVDYLVILTAVLFHALVELVLKEITDCLERGETVKLSSFGSFVVRKKGQRIGRNPKTGKEVPISPRRVMVFKPSAILKQRINSGPDGTELNGN